MLAFVDRAGAVALDAAAIHRDTLPCEGFEALGDAGMWVSRRRVRPLRAERLTGLAAQLALRGVALRAVDSLLPLKALWQSSLHASGIRLRNVEGWGDPGWPHSRRV